MSQVHDPQTWPTPALFPFPDDTNDLSVTAQPFRGSLGVLIRVPTIAPERVLRTPRKPSTRATLRVHTIAARTRKVGTRRRIRREIRMTGSIIMTIAPLILAALLLRGIPSSRESRGATVGHTSSTPISLSIEPPAIANVLDRTPTIHFPGYLLPIDRAEEMSHAGR
jgi:hypothetical protein